MLYSNFTSILFNIVMVSIFQFLSMKEKTKKQKKYEFECGFNPISKSRLSFSTQFFLITILFLIFDLEIAIIMPIMMEESKTINLIFLMNFIILVLTVGLLIEWKQGMVEWSK